MRAVAIISTFLMNFFIISFQLVAQPFQVKNLTRYVDPFIGVQLYGDEGNVFPGASLPFGMVRLGPDMNLYIAESGYVEGKDIIGFSHTHTSGTGGIPSYGNILTMATIGKPNIKDYSSKTANETARPGYFGVQLTMHNIKAELTVTQHTGFHQYTFPQSDSATILFDAGSFIGQDTSFNFPQILVGSEVEILSNSEVQGYNRIRAGWTNFAAFSVYFYAKFESPSIGFGTWKDTKIMPGNKLVLDTGDKTGAYFLYKTSKGQQIRVKVGISYISCNKARYNLENENPGWDFNKIVADANDIWNKHLSTALVEGGTEDEKKIFYTALFHSMLMPTDKSGENHKWTNAEPYYDDFYCIWDTYRCNLPLINLLLSSRGVGITRSLIDIYKHDGYMPEGRIAGDNGLTQGGSNADVVVADAFAKGLKGINYIEGLNAMIKDAEVPPGEDERKQGRGGIPDYNSKGYISTKYERSGNRTLEYAYNDWCIAQVAKGLEKKKEYLTYINRSINWENLWNPTVTSFGAKGFIWPRNEDGSWADSLYEKVNLSKYSPMGCYKFSVFSAGSFPNFMYESHSWEYSFYVPQDVKKLMLKCGGKDAFVSRLDTFFIKSFFNVNNEPGFLTPYLYIWAGRPDKTAYWVNYIRNKHFNSGRRGIPGNEDSGAMSSLYAFNAMGFYPNAGQDVYLITSPIFDKTTIQMDNGKNFTITAKNVSKEDIYVQSAMLNGKPLNQAWFRHTDISNGGTLELVMGNKSSSWGTSNPPPSMSDSE